jgi:16S rRNA C967 or C1407 C5-methylase (RsmB/RsmF family)
MEREHSQTEFRNTSLADQITRLLKERGLELEAISTAEQKALHHNLEKRELTIADQEVVDLLREYGITTEIKEQPQGYYELATTNHFDAKKKKPLPTGYAFKGGAARALLVRSLGIDPFAQPRDLDIVRLSEEEPYPGADDEIAQSFMPDDYKYGTRIEQLDDLAAYFNTRDLTLNEVLATDEKIWVTKQGLLDTIRRIIRPTEYEFNKDDYQQLNDKMLSKIVSFYAQSIERYDEATITADVEYQFERHFISPFWLALQLDRAYEKNPRVAEEFVQELKRKNQIPPGIPDAQACATYLLKLLKAEGGSFYYRHAPVEQFVIEQELVDKYEQSPKQYGMRNS